ncbi:MAG TPA: prepilin-type N-terminal cleavage/methylation domain-containing protein [Phycisphaerae bacterium]|nr:prepilin-type N-terminal cleavage/methylation domain-containing protein [Phycisphaerae bacterium]
MPATSRRNRRTSIQWKRPGAFTLIELLVVIAIISLLLAILLPSLSNARRSGRAVVCQTRLRSMGQAMQMYADSFDGAIVRGEHQPDIMHFAIALLPALGYEGPFSTLGQLFQNDHERLLKIFGEIDSYQCPDFPTEAQRLDFVVNAYPADYAAGPAGAGDASSEPVATDGDSIIYDHTSRLRLSASSLIYVTEGHAKLPTDELYLRDLFFAAHLPFATAPRIANDKRHPSGLNALFVDGHVEQMRSRRLDPGYPQLAAERLRYFTVVSPALAGTLQ